MPPAFLLVAASRAVGVLLCAVSRLEAPATCLNAPLGWGARSDGRRYMRACTPDQRVASSARTERSRVFWRGAWFPERVLRWMRWRGGPRVPRGRGCRCMFPRDVDDRSIPPCPLSPVPRPPPPVNSRTLAGGRVESVDVALYATAGGFSPWPRALWDTCLRGRWQRGASTIMASPGELPCFLFPPADLPAPCSCAVPWSLAGFWPAGGDVRPVPLLGGWGRDENIENVVAPHIRRVLDCFAWEE